MHSLHPSLMNLKLPNGIDKIDRVMEGFQVYQTLLAALDLGVFDYLDQQGPCDRHKISEGTGINGMFSKAFLATLVELGLVTQQAETYTNTKAATDFLLERSPFFQGEWIRNAAQGNSWNNLADALRRDQPQADNFSAGPSASFINALGQRALRGELQAVTETISNWNGFYNAKTVLDIGGGHGLYAIALCQTHPHLKGVIYDKPHVIDATRLQIEKYQMHHRLSANSGDICEDSLGSEYDIVIISHLLYKFRKNLGPIFDKVAACLNPGGLLVTNHWFCAEGCVIETSGISELAKALQSFGHPLCHTQDFDRLFVQKGFSIVSTTAVPTAFGYSRLTLSVKAPLHSTQRACSPTSCCC